MQIPARMMHCSQALCPHGIQVTGSVNGFMQSMHVYAGCMTDLSQYDLSFQIRHHTSLDSSASTNLEMVAFSSFSLSRIAFTSAGLNRSSLRSSLFRRRTWSSSILWSFSCSLKEATVPAKHCDLGWIRSDELTFQLLSQLHWIVFEIFPHLWCMIL